MRLGVRRTTTPTKSNDMPKRRATTTDQTSIDGTQPPDQKTDRKIENRGSKYVEYLAQRMVWQKLERNAKVELDAVLEERGVTEYWLKDGTQVLRVDGAAKIKIKFPKNDDGTVDETEARVSVEVDD